MGVTDAQKVTDEMCNWGLGTPDSAAPRAHHPLAARTARTVSTRSRYLRVTAFAVRGATRSGPDSSSAAARDCGRNAKPEHDASELYVIWLKELRR